MSKKKSVCKKFFAVLTSLALLLSCNAIAFAAEMPSTSVAAVAEEVSPASNSYSSSTAVDSSSWKTVATSTTGFGCNIKLSSLGTTITYVSVRMLSKSGSVLWSETNSFGSQGSRVYWCGTDVYKVQVKYVSGEGTIYCYPTS